MQYFKLLWFLVKNPKLFIKVISALLLLKSALTSLIRKRTTSNKKSFSSLDLQDFKKPVDRSPFPPEPYEHHDGNGEGNPYFYPKDKP